jgi:hypothetical protein
MYMFASLFYSHLNLFTHMNKCINMYMYIFNNLYGIKRKVLRIIIRYYRDIFILCIWIYLRIFILDILTYKHKHEYVYVNMYLFIWDQEEGAKDYYKV